MSEEKEPKPAPMKEVANFFLYKCKVCRSLTPDPANHSVTSEHISGYIAVGPISIEQEKTTEEIETDAKATEEATKNAASKVISAAAPLKPRKA